MKYLHTSDYISLHDFVLYWLIPNNVAASIIFLANTKSEWKKKGFWFWIACAAKGAKHVGQSFPCNFILIITFYNRLFFLIDWLIYLTLQEFVKS